MKCVPLSIALVSFLTSFSATAELPAEIKASCLKGGLIQKHAARGYVAQLEHCLKNGTPIDSIEDNGWTSLHAAAFNGKHDIVKLLLKRGANRALKDKNGKTPLDLAVSKKHSDIATTLKAKKPSNNAAKQLKVTDPKTLEMAEALRWELNTYGNGSSDDNPIDRKVAEILYIQSVKNNPDSDDISYKIKVKFKTGIFVDGNDEVIYESIIWEDSEGRITVGHHELVAQRSLG